MVKNSEVKNCCKRILFGERFYAHDGAGKYALTECKQHIITVEKVKGLGGGGGIWALLHGFKDKGVLKYFIRSS